MSNIGSRWAVVVVGRFLDEQHLERHREVDYVAKVITNTQGGELTENGRNYVFENTINEVDFWEVDSEAEARQLSAKFNKLWEKGVKQKLSILSK